MEFLNVAVLARIQFALTVAYHFFFVPFSIGLGLFMAISETRYYLGKSSLDEGVAKMIMRIFTATFAVGVATGITMEFAFGTNWADYSRFMGDVFGPPLAAEALFAFFLESIFLGVLLFGRKKVSPRFYMISAWLVFAGSCLSALWILIANSWMQTPAGYTVVESAAGTKAQITSFFAAALNPSLAARYLHTVDSVLVCGSFVMIALGAYYLLRKKDFKLVKRFLGVGVAVGLATVLLQVPFGHMSAVVVADYQPEKLAALEGQWEDGPSDMAIVGYVDEEGHETFALKVPIPGFTSFLASGDFEKSYQGLESFGEGNYAPVQLVFQAYHIMVLMFGVMVLLLLLAFLLYKKPSLQKKKWPARILMFSPLAAIFAIQFGWVVAEVGRQPWIVWHEMRTVDAISASVPASQVVITLVLFILFYTIIAIGWGRICLKAIKQGPVGPNGETFDALDGSCAADGASAGVASVTTDSATASVTDGAATRIATAEAVEGEGGER